MVTIFEDRNCSAQEVARLMVSVGWGREADYDSTVVTKSITTYPYVAYARDDQDALVGYVSAFSDGAFSTFIGELVVHPKAQRRGVGTRLLQAVESHFAGIPLYVKPFVDQEGFFAQNGYRVPSRPMVVMFKRTDRRSEPQF